MEALLAEAQRQFDEQRLREELSALVPSKPFPHEEGVRTVPSMIHYLVTLPAEGRSIEQQVTANKNCFIDDVKSHARCLQNCGLGTVYGFEMKVVAPPRIIRGRDNTPECRTLIAYFLFFDCSVDHEAPFTCEHGRVHRKCQCAGH